MFNVYKNQLSQQTGSRNLMGPKTLPTIWYTYMTLVTKYQISAINSYWEKCNEKYLGRTDRGKTIYPPPQFVKHWNNSATIPFFCTTPTIFQNINNTSKILSWFLPKCVKNFVVWEFCSSSAILESVSLANVIWYGYKETRTEGVMLNNATLCSSIINPGMKGLCMLYHAMHKKWIPFYFDMSS